jgi:DNA-3-methyladenine glycosylase I
VSIPPRHIDPSSLADYLDVMARAVFQSGISWSVIEAKWPGIAAAFDGFDPERVAAYTPDDVERLMGDKAVVRNRKKIEAMVRNAGELIVVDREFGGFKNYLGSFADNEALVKDLHKRFAFLGPSVAHFFLFSVGWDMPAQEAWAHEHFGSRDPRDRK